MKWHVARIAIGLAIVLLFVGHAGRFYSVGFITQLDNIIYDARMRPGCQLYQVYVERIGGLRRNLPSAGWDGVTRFETK